MAQEFPRPPRPAGGTPDRPRPPSPPAASRPPGPARPPISPAPEVARRKTPPPPPAAARPAAAQPTEGPEFFAEAELRAGSLDQLDYFQLFRLPATATPREIKEAFYRESRLYHPDRFAQLPDPKLKETLCAIYKRVTEAYVVLRDDRKRAKYLADLAGPDRDKKLRYTEASEVEQKAEAKKAVEEQMGTTPKGRECFRNGLRELEARRFDAALRQFKMALMYEPSNARYKEKAQEAESLWQKSRPKNDFRIR
jgi:DnaJ-domain-containing protein 1